MKNVKIMVEKNKLIVKGGRQETSDDEKNLKYYNKIKFEPVLFKISEIKAEMKNGLLKVVLPKLKEEERVNGRTSFMLRWID
ncbi:hypothetical protein FRX31_013647 [Thalictrum thalictroides]|uniref:SHSP domain-containing protein n=1 Tax=Thalictrum thalictroides TaxID=46969 RepID=A0A7J6WH48_THATH|nr:hypothetical protein FRX31_013647 [Thalictrum thalictroides]